MSTATVSATWSGSVSKGDGHVLLGGDVHSFDSLFGGESRTAPDDIVEATEASWFSLALAFTLGEAGFCPNEIHTEASVTLDPDDLEIASLNLDATAEVPDVDTTAFQDCVQKATEGCPVSIAANGSDIEVVARLIDR